MSRHSYGARNGRSYHPSINAPAPPSLAARTQEGRRTLRNQNPDLNFVPKTVKAPPLQFPTNISSSVPGVASSGVNVLSQSVEEHAPGGIKSQPHQWKRNRWASVKAATQGDQQSLEVNAQDTDSQGHIEEQTVSATSRPLSGAWREVTTPSGQVYYWNVATNHTQWALPDTIFIKSKPQGS